MKKLFLTTLALCGVLLANNGYAERDERGGGEQRRGDEDRGRLDDDDNKPVTLAVYGDWPYSTTLLNNASLLINSVNNDPDVRLVLHIGDIHSGSMACTGVGLNPIPAGSVPGWNIGIFNLFQQFKDPFVYTPGDNEWTDCHKTKQFSSGDPLKELTSVRELFFPNPGYTIGSRMKRVLSQAESYDPHHPIDSQFVENVIWEDARVIFVTVNMPGSNNDGLPWCGGGYSCTTGPFLNEPARIEEVAERTAADIRWLRRAFEYAEAYHARGVVIGLQADMWDPAALVTGGDRLDGYTTFVKELAKLALRFERPVLLINGDSHLFEADQPLADPTSATGLIHGTPAVPNLTRITVQGSTNHPSEWLRLTVDPRTHNVFSWENVVYLP